uniref:Retrotransposon gag domain-containing protein n=1 Tax=Photinus pyralis TaxID=7054 RepID=A0A1Y1MHC8_PHOPY
MEVSEKKIPRGPPPPESSRENRATHPEVETLTAAQICDKVRKWGVKFDGTQDSMAFLERIDELRECYGFTEADLLLALPELLKGKALLWYRNHKQTWRNTAVPIHLGGRNQKPHSTFPRTSHRICDRHFNVNATTWKYVQPQPIRKDT